MIEDGEICSAVSFKSPSGLDAFLTLSEQNDYVDQEKGRLFVQIVHIHRGIILQAPRHSPRPRQSVSTINTYTELSSEKVLFQLIELIHRIHSFFLLTIIKCQEEIEPWQLSM